MENFGKCREIIENYGKCMENYEKCMENYGKCREIIDMLYRSMSLYLVVIMDIVQKYYIL